MAVPTISPTIRLAMTALDEVESVLERVKDAPAALLLVERWRSFHRVLLGLCVDHAPTFVTADQEAALLGRILTLGEDANELADFLLPLDQSGSHPTWRPFLAKVRSGAA
jgi:hypothetical protein